MKLRSQISNIQSNRKVAVRSSEGTNQCQIAIAASRMKNRSASGLHDFSR